MWVNKQLVQITLPPRRTGSAGGPARLAFWQEPKTHFQVGNVDAKEVSAEVSRRCRLNTSESGKLVEINPENSPFGL